MVDHDFILKAIDTFNSKIIDEFPQKGGSLSLSDVLPVRRCCPNCKIAMHAFLAKDGGMSIAIEHEKGCASLPKIEEYKKDFKKKWGWDLDKENG